MYSFDEPRHEQIGQPAQKTTDGTPGKAIEPPSDIEAIFTARYYLQSKWDERRLEDRLRPKPAKVSSFDFERIRIISTVKEDSMLYSVTDGIISMHDTYRKIRGGIETDVWGQPLTLYLHQKVVWRLGKHEKIEIKYSGTKSISWTRYF